MKENELFQIVSFSEPRNEQQMAAELHFKAMRKNGIAAKMQIEISHVGPRNFEARGLSGEQSQNIENSNARPAPFQLKRKLPPLPTNIRRLDYEIECQEDNTLFCRETGQTIPPTPEGKPDIDQFLQETYFPRGFHPAQQCRR